MDLWSIFVLGRVKQAPSGDFDRLRNLATEHRSLHQMLGHTAFGDETTYQLQTIMDHVSLLTQDVIVAVNQAVVACRHRQLIHVPDAPLNSLWT